MKTIIFLLLAMPLVASAFDYKPNFNILSAGPFGMTQQQQAFTDSSITNQSNSNTDKLMSIITNGCKTYINHCLRFYYPKGTLGNGWNSKTWGILAFAIYQQYVPVFNIEYDWYFESGFDLTGGIGKIAPFLTYHQDGPWSGYSQITIWHTYAGQKGYFVPCVQDSTGGGITICSPASLYSKGPEIKTGQWYHIKMQSANGPKGYQKTWVNSILVFSNGPFIPKGTINLLPVIDFYSWFGGAGLQQAAKVDSYSRIDNVRIWSGTGL